MCAIHVCTATRLLCEVNYCIIGGANSLYNHMVSMGNIITNVAIHTVSCCWGEQEDIPSVPHSRAEPNSTTETSQDDVTMYRLVAPLTMTAGSQ